jgi:thiamine kinase-like enzyme
MAGLRGRVFSLLDTLRSQEQSITLCHNDLLAANRLRSGGMLWALDWEYCAMGSPWYDLAVVTCGDSLSEAETTDLVRACLGRPPLAADLARLADYSRGYRYLELLWYLALRKETEAGFVEQRAAALADAWTAL